MHHRKYLKRPHLSESVKKGIAGKQRYKCANKPGVILKGLDGYLCPLWNSTTDNELKGSFDESGYEIDHIDELATSGDNTQQNLQALCRMCHGVKTKRFNQQLMKMKDNEHPIDQSHLSKKFKHTAKHKPRQIFIIIYRLWGKLRLIMNYLLNKTK